MRDRIAEDHLALRVDAPGSVERNVAVEAQLSQVVDLVEGTSGRDKYLGARGCGASRWHVRPTRELRVFEN